MRGVRVDRYGLTVMAPATRALVLAAIFGLLAQLLFYREVVGLNVPVAAAALLAAAWLARSARPATIDLWLPLTALAFAAFAAIRTEPAVVAFDILALLTLAAAWTASLRGFVVTRARFPLLITEAIRTATGLLWRGVPLVARGIEPLSRSAPRAGRALPYLAGVALAVPFVLIFAALFRSADPVFARSWDELTDLTRWWSGLAEAKDRGLIALAAAALAGGALAARPAASAPERRLSAPAALPTAFLGTIAALFATFVYVQVAYLFGGSDTLAAASVSYSEYARRGFFELLVAAGLVGALLFVSDLVVGRATRAYAAVAATLIGLTLVIAASAAYRLVLYQGAYGWSEQRLYAGAAIAAVMGSLAILAAAVLTRRTAFALQPIVALMLGVALTVNALGPASVVVRANVARAVTSDEPVSARRFDAWYLAFLGPAALPAVVAERERLSDPDRRCLDFALFQRYRFENTAQPSWQSWNADRERAREALIRLKETVFPAIDPRDMSACRY